MRGFFFRIGSGSLANGPVPRAASAYLRFGQDNLAYSENRYFSEFSSASRFPLAVKIAILG